MRICDIITIRNENSICIKQRGNMTQKKRVWAAGGVLMRQANRGNYDIVICGRHRDNLWALPKGRPDGHETHEAVAIREVTEETGIVPKINCKIGEVHYNFERQVKVADAVENVFYDKTVVFFLMSPIAGSVEKHDNEYDEVVWLNSDEACKRLKYTTDIEIVKRAIKLFKE
jgi:8-oxo-dGTP pyrophosphatase MutT (NUDIX family)